MTKQDKINTLLETLKKNPNAEISRGELIQAVISNGLIEKDSYPVLKPWTRGEGRGQYSVSLMTSEAEKILNKFKAKSDKVVKKAAKKAPVAKKAPKKIVTETIIDDEDDSSCLVVDGTKDAYTFEPIAPTQDDIVDELSCMGTYL